MKLEINARGLTQEEIQSAIDTAYRLKQPGAIEEWEERRKRIIHEITRFDPDFAKELIQEIKNCHPELLKDV